MSSLFRSQREDISADMSSQREDILVTLMVHVAVVRYFKSEIILFFVNHFGKFLVDLTYNSPPKPFLLDYKFLFTRPFFSHL